MKKLQRALALLLALALLTGCGGGSGSSGADGSPSGAASPAESADSAAEGQSAPPAGDATTISFWHLFSGSEAQMLQDVVDKFNQQNPDIFVEALEGTTEEKQLVAISGGTPPDVCQILDTTFSQMATAGMATELDGYFADAGVDTGNFNASAKELNMLDGKLMGAPFTMDAFLLFYNKDILEEIGETEPPKTISELVDFSQRSTKTDTNGDYERVGMVPDWPWIDVPNFIYHFGGQFYDFETGKITANSEANLEALNFKAGFYSDPYDREKLIKFKSGFGQYQSSENAFFQGKIAFAVEGEWYPTFIEQFAPELNYGVAPVPYPDGKEDLRDVGRLQTAVLFIPANSSNQDAAFRFLNYLVSDEAQLDFNIAKGGLPVTTSALNDPRLTSEAPHLEPFAALVKAEKARTFPAVPFANEYFDALYTAEETIYNQGLDPKEVMDGIVEKYQPVADEWNSK